MSTRRGHRRHPGNLFPTTETGPDRSTGARARADIQPCPPPPGLIGEAAGALLIARPAVAALGPDRNGCRCEPIRDVAPDYPSRLVERVVVPRRQQQAGTHAIAHALRVNPP